MNKKTDSLCSSFFFSVAAEIRACAAKGRVNIGSSGGGQTSRSGVP